MKKIRKMAKTNRIKDFVGSFLIYVRSFYPPKEDEKPTKPCIETKMPCKISHPSSAKNLSRIYTKSNYTKKYIG